MMEKTGVTQKVSTKNLTTSRKSIGQGRGKLEALEVVANCDHLSLLLG